MAKGKKKIVQEDYTWKYRMKSRFKKKTNSSSWEYTDNDGKAKLEKQHAGFFDFEAIEPLESTKNMEIQE